MISIKKMAVGAVLALAMGGGMVLAASPASAAAPGWEPDPNSNGTLSFYNAAGKQVTSGSNLNHLFDYALASSTEDPAGFHKANIAFAYPDHTQADPINWFVNGSSAATNYPNAAAPAPLNATGSTPLVTVAPTEMNLIAAKGGATLDTTAGFVNIVQIRVTQSSGTGYWAGDISFNTTNGTWRQVYAVAANTTSTVVSAAPSPGTTGQNVTLTATVQTGDLQPGAGTVQFRDGATAIGAPQTVNGSGVATFVTNALSQSTHTINADFTPADTSAATGQVASTGSTSETINAPAPADSTTTAVTGSTTGTVGSGQQITATVSDTTTPATKPAGTVQFTIDGVNAGSPVTLVNGVGTFQYTPTNTSAHTIKASYTPANPALFNASADAVGITVTATAPANAPDPQNLTVSVTAGTLVISTPYTAAHPLSLGTLQLNGAGTQYATTPVAFGTSATAGADPGNLDANPAASVTNGVTITDTRAGSPGWTASAQTTDFTSGGNSIDGNGLSFTGVTPKYITGNHLQAPNVTTNDITAFKTLAKSFATTTVGPGTVNVYGNMSLVAPTSTVAGTYTATVTFTIV
jgi:hypothetical protein